MPSPRTILPLGLLFTLGCATGGGTGSAPAASPSSIEAEARAFMEGYAEDLRAGNRDGIVARYDARGAWIVFQGERRFLPLDAIRARYHGGWTQPHAFEWRELSYEPAGPDAVAVVGGFLWITSPADTSRFSYTAHLARGDNGLRIRIENETAEPRPGSSSR